MVVKSQNTKSASQAELDSDNDGLMDWEETLWNADPKNPDTDGDGTSDNIEVKSGRNPIVPGPNDSLAQKANTASEEAEVAQQELTPTGELGIELFQKYMILKNSGATMDETTITELVNGILQEKGTITEDQYTSSDIHVGNSDNENAYFSYGNSLGQMIIDSPPQTENELLILQRFADSGDKSELPKLDPFIASFKATLQSELSMDVPRSALSLHVEFVNATAEVLGSLQAMRKAAQDEFELLILLNGHLSSATRLRDSILSLQEYFNDRKVIFTDKDAGYSFMYGI